MYESTLIISPLIYVDRKYGLGEEGTGTICDFRVFKGLRDEM